MKKMNNDFQDHLINAIIALALIAIVLAIMTGCSTLPPADGPDAPQLRDANGHPNFGT